MDTESQLTPTTGSHTPNLSFLQSSSIGNDDRPHQSTISQQRIPEPQVGAAGRPRNAPLPLSKRTHVVREGGVGASPGHDLSPVIGKVNGAAGRGDSTAVEYREQACGIHHFARSSKEALHSGIGGQLLTCHQHSLAVLVELGLEPVSIVAAA